MQSDLIRIGSDRVKAIRAHDLHRALGIRSRLTTWIDREIEKHDLVDGVDYVDAVARRTDAGRRDAWFTVGTASRIASSTERATRIAVIDAIDDIARAPIVVNDASAAVDGDASPMDDWSPPKVTTEIIDGVERSTVDLRDLYRSLRVRTGYDLWSGRRLEEFGFIEGREVHSILTKRTGEISIVTKRVTIRAANECEIARNSAPLRGGFRVRS